MAKTSNPNIRFGGVDSRSDPLMSSPDRCLRSINWRPMPDGHMELREGYQAITQGTVNAGAIHSVAPFRTTTGDKYLVFWQDKTPYLLKLADGTVTSPTVKGKAVASNARWSYYLANNRLHGVNGTDAKVFDGTCWRDLGLPQLTDDDVKDVVVSAGVSGLTSAQAASVVVTPTAGGSSPGSTYGYYFYVMVFDPTTNQLGPAVKVGGASRIQVAAGQKAAITGLPDLSSVDTNLIKLFSITQDGASQLNLACVTGPGVYVDTIARSSNTATVVFKTAHSFGAGDILDVWAVTDDSFNGVFKVLSTPDSKTVTYLCPGTDTTTASSSYGASTKAIVCANAATSVDVPNVAQALPQPSGSASLTGLNATSVGGAQPGYQLYGAIYNPSTGHVGNRKKLGERFAPSTKSNAKLSSLPDLSAKDAEWQLLMGRTGDGAEVPYAIVDKDANWKTVPNGKTEIVISDALIDGSKELPIDNTAPPEGLRSVARVGDRAYGILDGQPSVYRTNSEASATSGDYVGRPEQSWPGTTETFPTADHCTAVSEYAYDAVVATLNDVGILSDPLNSGLGWQGPWNIGFCGQFAQCKGWNGLPYWISGDKQLCTIGPSGPMAISEEYEAALLAQIDDAHLSEVEMVYERIPHRFIDRLRIHFTGDDGKEHHVFHDFRLREVASPAGQAYEYVYQGPLATPHTIVSVRDGNDKSRTYAAAQDGQIYMLDEGVSDAGTEFSADRIAFLNFGDNRPLVGPFEYHGDDAVKWSISKDTTSADLTNATNFEELEQQAYPTDEDDHHWLQHINAPEMPHAFVRLQLDSHSADATNGMDLNTPPHVPLEVYGRIWAASVEIGGARG